MGLICLTRLPDLGKSDRVIPSDNFDRFWPSNPICKEKQTSAVSYYSPVSGNGICPPRSPIVHEMTNTVLPTGLAAPATEGTMWIFDNNLASRTQSFD